MSHEHQADDDIDVFSQDFWDSRYRSARTLWSDRPNQRLVENLLGLPPGDSLDIGCGEGADAIWLAQHGFRVTAVDVSAVALDRGRRHAEAVGRSVADRITWLHADVRTWRPRPRSFDLVSQQFLHVPADIRSTTIVACAAAVRPGGTLLVVGHHPSDLGTTARRPHGPGLLFTAEEVAEALDPAEWEISAGSPTREATDPDGRTVTVTDAVLKAVRLPTPEPLSR